MRIKHAVRRFMIRMITKYRCVICGKLTAGRLPNAGWGNVGDGTFIFPRYHKHKGKPCPGNVLEAEWVNVDSHGRVVGKA